MSQRWLDLLTTKEIIGYHQILAKCFTFVLTFIFPFTGLLPFTLQIIWCNCLQYIKQPPIGRDLTKKSTSHNNSFPREVCNIYVLFGHVGVGFKLKY